MKICLAGTSKIKEEYMKNFAEKYKLFILESFAYMTPSIERLIPKFSHFILDSGAFTFMNCNKDKIPDINEYMNKYADFIIKNNVKNFIEMDIDNVIGYEKVLELRKELEKKVGRKCIPVFHKSRGLKEWEKTLDEYDYVAIGGMKEFKNTPLILKKLVDMANKKGVKVHGLGYTSIKGIKNIKFYSVDSTTWCSGNKFGYVFKFNKNKLERFSRKENQRMTNLTSLEMYNLEEWIKFQQYISMTL